MAFTFFFRDWQTLDAVTDLMVPEMAGRSKVRIWDAGCAMGPEPYTLAIILASKMGQFAFKNIIMDVTDIDESGDFGSILEKGEYPYSQLQRIPKEYFNTYFTRVDDTDRYRICDDIRKRLEFRWHDLRSLQPVGSGFSLIVCKNVLLHLQPDMRVKVMRMFHDSLAAGGYLVMENTQPIADELTDLFESVVNGIRIYRKVEGKCAVA